MSCLARSDEPVCGHVLLLPLSPRRRPRENERGLKVGVPGQGCKPMGRGHWAAQTTGQVAILIQEAVDLGPGRCAFALSPGRGRNPLHAGLAMTLP